MAVLIATRRLLVGLFYVSPWAWLTAFGTALALTIAQVGHFPSYGNPDPKQVDGMYLPYWAIYLLIIPVLMSPLVVATQTVWRLIRKSGVDVRAVAAYGVGFALFGAIAFGDAFGLRNWIMD